MTEWNMTTYDGRTFVLPAPLGWRLEYGLGNPCDGFWVRLAWTAGQEDVLADGVRMTVTRDGQTLFVGVVDECRCQWSETGAVAEISGRGMQALLLDNQAEAADYGVATLEEILRNYVTPFGIETAERSPMPAVAGFSVASGSSCWGVVYDFARYHGGVTPRFDPFGRLVLSGWKEGTPVRLGAEAPVKRAVWREKRYGVLSQVTVKDVSGWGRQTVVNEAFQRRGGRCSRVMVVPRKTGFQARRYRGTFQLDRSAAELTEVEVTVAIPFAAWPGDLVELAMEGWKKNGVYRVKESRVEESDGGVTTTLVLCLPEAVL